MSIISSKSITNSITAMLLLSCLSCTLNSKELPILGEPEIVQKVVDGKTTEVKIYPTIPDFAFRSQYGDTITAQNFKDKIYVADFFFVTCPTICPVMKKNMLKVYDEFKGNPDVGILSHSIDPAHDTVEVLKKYADDLGIKGRTWLFVTGSREKIYDIGEKHYLVTAHADDKEPGGYIHSGAFVLIDKQKHIRGMYDGTNEKEVRELIDDMKVLLKEKAQ
ncbi:MAG: SCO family protein [Bacteroidetes bacterium]|nr:SCO family protein [Bacteroidota bacterium]